MPEAEGKIKYDLVDKAIEAIKETGFKHEVCPFETVVECSFDELPALLEIFMMHVKMPEQKRCLLT